MDKIVLQFMKNVTNIFELFIEHMISHEQLRDKGVKVGICSKER